MSFWVKCSMPDERTVEFRVGKYARVESTLKKAVSEWKGGEGDYRDFMLAVDAHNVLNVAFRPLASAHPDIEAHLVAKPELTASHPLELQVLHKAGSSYRPAVSTTRHVSGSPSSEVVRGWRPPVKLTDEERAQQERESREHHEREYLARLSPEELISRGDAFQQRMHALTAAFSPQDAPRAADAAEEALRSPSSPPPCAPAVSSLLRSVSEQLLDKSPLRSLALLSTDKPIYRPGEEVRARVVLLDAHTGSPQYVQGLHAGGRFEVLNARDEVVLSAAGAHRSCFLWAVFSLPGSLPGGSYCVRVTLQSAHASAEDFVASRTFDVWQHQDPPPLRMQMHFVRKALSAGERAVALLSVSRREGGLPSTLAVCTAVALVDGEEAFRAQLSLDQKGQARVQFTLPPRILTGEGSLSVTVEDEGSLATVTRTIPIVLTRLDVRAYPEGGELVDGLPARLYLEAFTNTGDPADFAGSIVELGELEYERLRGEEDNAAQLEDVEHADNSGVDAGASSSSSSPVYSPYSFACPSSSAHCSPVVEGVSVVDVCSSHEGRARVEFTPRAGHRYALRIREPASVKLPVLFPFAVLSAEQGVVLRASQDVYRESESLRVEVGTRRQGALRVSVFKKEREVAQQVLPGQETHAYSSGSSHRLGSAFSTVTFTMPHTGGICSGVLRVTVFDAVSDQPLAERLLFRQPSKHIRIKVRTASVCFMCALVYGCPSLCLCVACLSVCVCHLWFFLCLSVYLLAL
jgi:hypothetical protein